MASQSKDENETEQQSLQGCSRTSEQADDHSYRVRKQYSWDFGMHGGGWGGGGGRSSSSSRRGVVTSSSPQQQ